MRSYDPLSQAAYPINLSHTLKALRKAWLGKEAMHANIGHRVGVSASIVGHWLSGRYPIPKGREAAFIEAIKHYLEPFPALIAELQNYRPAEPSESTNGKSGASVTSRTGKIARDNGKGSLDKPL